MRRLAPAGTLQDQVHVPGMSHALGHVQAARSQTVLFRASQAHTNNILATRRHLFSARVGEDMKAFMGQKDQRGVFWYVMHFLRALSQPHIHELPDVGVGDLGIDNQLDLFDD